MEGLKGHRVLHVACGVWHSAAIASDRSDSGGPLQDLPYLESQAIQSKLASMYDQLDGVRPPSRPRVVGVPGFDPWS